MKKEVFIMDTSGRLRQHGGKDARRNAHDAKEKGSGDRTKKQIDEDYKINKTG